MGSIPSSKDLKQKPVVWAGGNPRTGQQASFILYDNITKTRVIMDGHEKDQDARDEKTYASDGGANRLNPEQQMGRVLTLYEMQARLKRMNPNFIFEIEQHNQERCCISIMQTGHNIKTGLTGTYKRFLCAMGVDPIPEFSIMGARMEDRPTRDGRMEHRMKHAYEKVRGWRTVLAKLHAAGFITEPQIEREFAITHGRNSKLWHEHIT